MNKTISALIALALVAGCLGRDEPETESVDDEKKVAESPAPGSEEDEAGGEGTPMALSEGRMGKADRSRGAKEAAPARGAAPADGDDAPGGEAKAPTRSWFPETFLFEPLVVTDAGGEASVSVAVPDRLTTWRVLALAHSRAGAQAGAVTRFLGTLAAYVDPVTPPQLRAGDRVRLPVQMVNTGAEPLATTLRVSATGARLAAPGGAVTLSPRSSAVRYATLTARQPGAVKLSASLGGADAVVETIDVIPGGKPVTAVRSGTLAAPRTLSIEAAELAAGENDRVRLRVYPGALAIVRSELEAAIGRGGIAGDAFALLLAGRAPALLGRLGDEPDADALRDLSILGTQRVVRYARTLDVTSATLLARAALAHPDNPILLGIGKRAVAFLETNQLPDGTCGGADGWTVQRLLVGTADCARAAAGSRRVLIRAGGAFERHAAHVKDPYTAAAILASGAPIGDQLAASLRQTVREAAVAEKNGARRIELPEKVVRADGTAPGSVEATAMAILGLAGDPKSAELRADLGATVLAAYSPGRGWGDGRANLVGLRALVSLFDKPIERDVTIELLMDGQVIASGELDAARLRDVVTLEASDVGLAGEREMTVRADPPLAGLGFQLELTTWRPWPPAASGRGLEIAAAPPARLSVGAAADWTITVAAPAGEPVEVTAAAPAGVQIDRARLDELVAGGTLSSYQLDDLGLALRAPALEPSQSLKVPLRVIPTLGGSLQSGPVTARVAGVSISAPPARWEVE